MTTKIAPLKQAPRQCGQTCLAMLSSKPVNEIVEIVESSSTTCLLSLVKGMRALGLYADERGWVPNPPRDFIVGGKVGVARIGWLKANSKTKVKKMGHFVVVANGKVYEPKDGGVYDYDEYMTKSPRRPTHFIEVLLP